MNVHYVDLNGFPKGNIFFPPPVAEVGKKSVGAAVGRRQGYLLAAAECRVPQVEFKHVLALDGFWELEGAWGNHRKVPPTSSFAFFSGWAEKKVPAGAHPAC